MTSEDQSPSWLVKFLHSFPHLDLTFTRVNSSFNPEDSAYKESLLFWAAVPILWLLFTLIAFLIYFCYRCCQQDVEKKRPVPCLVWTMSTFIFIALAVCGIGFYGNEVTKYSQNHIQYTTTNMDISFAKISRQSTRMVGDVKDSLGVEIQVLDRYYNRNDQNNLNQSSINRLNTLTDRLELFAASIQQAAEDVQNRVSPADSSEAVRSLMQLEFYRWLVTLLFLVWMVVLCTILLIGIGLKSKCTLLVFCACGIFTMVMCWLLAGVYTAVLLASADFCMNPDDYVVNHAGIGPDKAVVRYLFTCDSNNPFDQSLPTIEDNLHMAQHSVTDLENLADVLKLTRAEATKPLNNVKDAIDNLEETFDELVGSTTCTLYKSEYDRGKRSMCHFSVMGLAWILLALVLSGLLFTILVILASRAWKHFSRSYTQSATLERMEPSAPKTYLDGDVDEPLMFPPRDENGSYYSFSRSGRQGPRDQGPPRRPTPPPAYNSYELRPHHPASAPLADDDIFPGRYD